MTVYANEKEFQKRNFENRKNIGEDAVKAKESSVSYGKYKAGVGPDFASSEYPVSSLDYIRPKSDKGKDNSKRQGAFIR